MTQEIAKGEIGNSKLLGMANYNIYFKNTFTCLVMNITPVSFIYTYIYIYIYIYIAIYKGYIRLTCLHAFLALNVLTVEFSLIGLIKSILFGYLDA